MNIIENGGGNMEYIKSADYEYIMKKYDKENRFLRCDYLFSESSGEHPETIEKGIMRVFEENKQLPHIICKSLVFDYVLKNTRISCDKRDAFPAINMINRPLNPVFWQWRNEVFREIIPEIDKRRCQLESDGIATCWPDFDHSVPNWDRVFALGFKGILEFSENERRKHSLNNTLTDEMSAFYDGVKITYSAICDFMGRIADRALIDGNHRMAQALKSIQNNPPKTFYEALLVDYLYFIISEHVDNLQVRSLGNFDRLFYRFYKSDIENGVSEIEIRTDLAYFFLQFTSMNNYWNQPVFLGGCKEDESTEINELSYIFLDVYNKMNIYNPKIQIKLADSTPKEFVLKALDMIRNGNNSIVFVGDKTIRTALMNLGVTSEQARLCNVKGCYEYSVQDSIGTGMNYMNLLKPFEYAMHEGCDAVNGKFSGFKSPPIESYKTFDEFYNEYKRQIKNVIDTIVEVVNAYENYMSYANPLPMLSGTFESSTKKGTDIFDGSGVLNETVISFGYVANVADSLTNIKKYVFDQKIISFSELRKALDSNFEGYEKLQAMLRADRDKFGNNKELPDYFAKDIVDYLVKTICGRENAEKRGGEWNCGFHNARMSYIQGYVTAASADGRNLGEELSKNMSAQIGMNREGATAAILSTTKIDATAFAGDSCLDLGLLPSAVKGEDGLEAMYALLLTYIKRGGHALHINVFDAETLREAQKHPEKYSDLQIRVSGWNVLFNNINKEEQDGFIRQAESLI